MKTKELFVEIADTPYKHQTGLMFRKEMSEDHGMLFKFRKPQNLKFWGLNTYIPLAIAFVSSENKITKISYISPHSEQIVSSDEDCVFAIEANYDFFRKNGIWVGDTIEIKQNGNQYVDSCIKFSKGEVHEVHSSRD